MLNIKVRPRYAWYSFFFFVALIVATMGPKLDGPAVIHGAPPPEYSMQLNDTNTPTSSLEYTGETYRIGYTDFDYFYVKASPGNHIELGAGGGLYNIFDTPIYSVTSVTATFVTDGTLTLYTTFDTYNIFDYPLVSGVRVNLPNLPYYTDFWADENYPVTIESIVITYSCLRHDEESLDTYRVSWLNDDGSLLEIDMDVEPGTFPSYDGPIPTKEDDSGTIYTFSGWDNELSEVYGNVQYTAMYSEMLLTFTPINDDTEYRLDSIGDSTITSIQVPSLYLGLPVSGLHDSVFASFANLTTVMLPNSIDTIGAFAFMECTSLTSIEIPASVSVIGEGAFDGCSSLVSFVVDENNLHYASIDGVLFNNALTTLLTYPAGKGTTYTIPNGTVVIGEGAFAGCATLTSITIPSSVEAIGRSAFARCSSLNNVVIPNTVSTLSDSVFAFCTSLSSITLPSGLTTIPDSLFYHCTSLLTLTLSSAITSIGNSAFASCTALTSISLPEGLLTISSYAFQYCSSLNSVTLPSTLLTIGGNAFAWSGLTSITIPASVTSIGTFVFIECPLLTAINVHINNTTYTSNDGVLYDEDLTILINYPSGKTNNSFTVPASVTDIHLNAIRANPNLTSLYIPSSVTTIESHGVYLCTNLTIYCQALEKPAGWHELWNNSNRRVLWNQSF